MQSRDFSTIPSSGGIATGRRSSSVAPPAAKSLSRLPRELIRHEEPPQALTAFPRERLPVHFWRSFETNVYSRISRDLQEELLSL
jgi:hypothetical protein